MNCRRIAFVLLTGSLALSMAFAESLDGPELPCEDCPEFRELMQYPASGIWFNPDQAGSGFTLEIQDGIAAGYYFLYDEDGRPEWLMFTDELEFNEDENNDARWVLETDLLRFSGGACLGCPYQPFEEVESVATLTMEFPWRNHGRFSVDDGAAQRIIPMAYAIPMVSGLFKPYSDVPVPSLIDGDKTPPLSPRPIKESWIFVFRIPSGLGWSYRSLPVTMGIKEPDEDGNMVTTFGAFLGGEFGYEWGTLSCQAEADSGPMCRLDFDEQATSDHLPIGVASQPYYLAPGNIGHDRIEAESANGGATLIGYRIDYD